MQRIRYGRMINCSAATMPRLLPQTQHLNSLLLQEILVQGYIELNRVEYVHGSEVFKKFLDIGLSLSSYYIPYSYNTYYKVFI
jgi:hypothetical protein